MTAPGVRSAQALLDAARTGIERLNDARRPADNVADLVAAWKNVEEALRTTLGLTTLAGNELIREARQHGVLTLDQAHALVAFGAVADRMREAGAVVTAEDIDAGRAAMLALESPPGSADALVTAEAGAAPVPTPDVPPPPTNQALPLARSARGKRLPLLVGLTVLIVVAGVAAYYAWYFRRGPDHLAQGIEAYQAGDAGAAHQELEAAVRAMPSAALPHVYLARLAREAGDPVTAASELTTAIRLEPDNAVALREMGSYALSIGDLDLARRFYVRALEQDPTDRPALGYLACTLARLGRPDEAQTFLRRAGDGAWSPCVAQAATPSR